LDYSDVVSAWRGCLYNGIFGHTHGRTQSKSTALLQDDLNKTYQWSLFWQLKLNLESICISFKRSSLKCNYKLNGEPIPSKSVIQYLRIYINSCLKWSDHVKYISARATHSLNYLRHTLFSTTPFVKSAAYNCLIRPLLEYASPVWYLHSTDKLEAIQRHAAGWVCGIPTLIVGLNLLPLVSRISTGPYFIPDGFSTKKSLILTSSLETIIPDPILYH